MKHQIRFFAFVLTLALSVSMPAQGAPIGGPPGQSSGADWQSAYVNIDPPRDFHKGERLKIQVQGTAEWVRVRLLPEKAAYDSAAGLIANKMKVPPGGVLELVLKEDRPRVKQVSVHAGKLAWDELLNPNGGTVQIVSVDVAAP